MIRFGELKRRPAKRGDAVTTIYGWICEYGLIEAFATHPSASGTSDAMLGTFHLGSVGWNINEITQARFNTAFLIWIPEDEMESEDLTLSLGELIVKYPLEEES